MRTGTYKYDIKGEPNTLLAMDASGDPVHIPIPVGKTPVTLANAATVNFDLAASYNFLLAISAGNKTMVPLNIADGDNWAIVLTGCASQVLTLGPVAGYTHRVGGVGAATTLTLPASGHAILAGLRIGNVIYWTLTTF